MRPRLQSSVQDASCESAKVLMDNLSTLDLVLYEPLRPRERPDCSLISEVERVVEKRLCQLCRFGICDLDFWSLLSIDPFFIHLLDTAILLWGWQIFCLRGALPNRQNRTGSALLRTSVDLVVRQIARSSKALALTQGDNQIRGLVKN